MNLGNARDLILIILILVVSTTVWARVSLDEEESELTYPAGVIDKGCSVVYDPYEKLNRKIFMFNSTLDYFILRPVAVVYRKATGDYVKARVNSFMSNIATPLTSVNYALQGNFTDSMKSLWRFAINTTIGVAGLFDVASKAGLSPTAQTFGNTLAHYGIGPGPYLVVPFFGGTNARDALDPLVFNNALNPVKYYLHSSFKNGMFIVKMVNDRAEVLPVTDYVSANSPDPYIAIREAIHQNREFNVEYPTTFKCPLVK